MQYEVEQKFPVADLAALERALIALGAKPQEPIEQVDRYFAHPAKDYAQSDEALRIRRVGQENFVTYKGPKLDKTTKTRREIELPLEPGEVGFQRFAELFESLGFRTVAEVRKTRRPFELHWEGRTVQAVLDRVASVGTFAELELVVEPAEVEAAKACLASLVEKLRLTHVERRSYLEMLLTNESSK